MGTQPPAVSVASTHSSTSYLSSQQQAAVMKQHQLLLDQQKQREQQQKHLQQQQFLQRQQHLLAEQVKRKAGENPAPTPSRVCLPPRSRQWLQASVCMCMDLCLFVCLVLEYSGKQECAISQTVVACVRAALCHLVGINESGIAMY